MHPTPARYLLQPNESLGDLTLNSVLQNLQSIPQLLLRQEQLISSLQEQLTLAQSEKTIAVLRVRWQERLNDMVTLRFCFGLWKQAYQDKQHEETLAAVEQRLQQQETTVKEMTRRLYPQRFWEQKSQKKGIPADKMAEVDKRVRSLQAIADQHKLGTIHIVYDKDAPDFNVGSYMVKDEEWMERLPEIFH